MTIATVVNNLPSTLQNLDPGIRQGDVGNLALAVGFSQFESTSNAVTASTTQTQVGGTVLNAYITRVTSANANDAVTLGFTAAAGMSFVIINDSGNIVTLFPKSGDKINDANQDAGVTLADNTISYYCSPVKNLWFGGPSTLET